MKVRIAIVDDRSQNRISLTEKIRLSEEIDVVFAAANGAEFLDEMKLLAVSDYPAVVLMDIEMPVMNGIEAVRTGKLLYPEIKFLMLTVFDNDDTIFEAIKAGADGYLLKDEKITAIVECIQQLSEVGGAPMSPRIARKALDLLIKAPSIINAEPNTKDIYLLTDRENEVLLLLIDGYQYRTIAEKLFISTHTVRRHIANIYNKLHVTSKAQAIKLATRNKIV